MNRFLVGTSFHTRQGVGSGGSPIEVGATRHIVRDNGELGAAADGDGRVSARKVRIRVVQVDGVVGHGLAAVGIGYGDIVPSFAESGCRLRVLCVIPHIFVVESSSCLELGASRSRDRGRTVIAVARLFRLVGDGGRQSGRHLHGNRGGGGLAAGVLHGDGNRQRLGFIHYGDVRALCRRLCHHKSVVCGAVVGSGRTHDVAQVGIGVAAMAVVHCIDFRAMRTDDRILAVAHGEAVRSRHRAALAVRHRHIGSVGVAAVVGAGLRNSGAGVVRIGGTAPRVVQTAVVARGRHAHGVAALVRTEVGRNGDGGRHGSRFSQRDGISSNHGSQ